MSSPSQLTSLHGRVVGGEGDQSIIAFILSPEPELRDKQYFMTKGKKAGGGGGGV
jgi:hypothetical protein